MNDAIGPENYVDLLTQFLAELADRLRHCSAQPIVETAVPASTARLEVTAALLRSADLRPDMGALAGLGDSLVILLDGLRDCPGRDLRYLEPALDFLAETLEAALIRLDTGEQAQDLEGDPVWLGVLSRLNTAGTPLEIMDELDACARLWEDRWCEQEFSLGQDQELSRRWLTFREYGDAMFGLPPGQKAEPSPAESSHAPVVLLVSSLLRREQLLHKLQGLGIKARAAVSLEDALERTLPTGPAGAIICDNMLPSNHLDQLVRRKQGHNRYPALILITSGSGHRSADLQRARSLGADGVWAEPFNTEPLAGLPDK